MKHAGRCREQVVIPHGHPFSPWLDIEVECSFCHALPCHSHSDLSLCFWLLVWLLIYFLKVFPFSKFERYALRSSLPEACNRGLMKSGHFVQTLPFDQPIRSRVSTR